jgi:hypothetical protein
MFAITADYSRPSEKLAKMKARIDFHWINWQLITSFLEKHLDIKGNAALFAIDLYNLLVKKHLRMFEGFLALPKVSCREEAKTVFYNYRISSFARTFLGFKDLPNIEQLLSEAGGSVFFHSELA